MKRVAAVLMLTGLALLACDPYENEFEENEQSRMELVSHEYDDGCWEGDCYGGERWDDGWGGGGSDGNTGYDGEGGRSGDMDQSGDGNCRNFCFYGVPMPGEGGRG